jgi:hypothetical protein
MGLMGETSFLFKISFQYHNRVLWYLSRPSGMSFHGKFLPPFNWTELDPPLQTKILQDATRRFVMQSEDITLCFERPMHPKLLLFPAQLIITYKNSNGDNVEYKWTNVFQLKFTGPTRRQAHKAGGLNFIATTNQAQLKLIFIQNF